LGEGLKSGSFKEWKGFKPQKVRRSQVEILAYAKKAQKQR